MLRFAIFVLFVLPAFGQDGWFDAALAPHSDFQMTVQSVHIKADVECDFYGVPCLTKNPYANDFIDAYHPIAPIRHDFVWTHTDPGPCTGIRPIYSMRQCEHYRLDLPTYPIGETELVRVDLESLGFIFNYRVLIEATEPPPGWTVPPDTN